MDASGIMRLWFFEIYGQLRVVECCFETSVGKSGLRKETVLLIILL